MWTIDITHPFPFHPTPSVFHADQRGMRAFFSTFCRSDETKARSVVIPEYVKNALSQNIISFALMLLSTVPPPH